MRASQPGPFDRGFQHKAIHHGGEHAHRVADRTRHAAFGNLYTAKDIAAADHDAELDTEFRARRKIRRKTFDRCLIDAEAIRGRQRFAGQFDDDTTINRATHALRSPISFARTISENRSRFSDHVPGSPRARRPAINHV